MILSETGAPALLRCQWHFASVLPALSAPSLAPSRRTLHFAYISRRGAPVEVWRPCPLLRPPRFDRCPVSHRSVASSTLPMFQALTRPLKCGRPCPLLHPTPNRPTADPSTPPVCPARLGPAAQGVLHQSASCCSAHLPPIHSRPPGPSSFFGKGKALARKRAAGSHGSWLRNAGRG